MLKPRLTDNELQRLQLLNALQLLDTGPDERFDRLTRMAKRLFDVPIALVSLVDFNRQWFKSCAGLDVTETSRDISFCGHAILGDEIFVIPDTTADVRFFDNPLVTGPPYIRFYAGCPLHVSRNAKVGTLCIIDTRPRQMTAADNAALKDLAGMVQDELAAFQAATTDPLTGVWNRRGFLNVAQASIEFCARKDQPVTLACIDLDGFKAINDAHGHNEGDAVLRRIADGMTHSFRSSDAIARMGGDEFVALMPAAGETDAYLAIARLRAWLGHAEARLGLPYRTQFSTGCVVRDALLDRSVNDLITRADAAMYRMKRQPLPGMMNKRRPGRIWLPN
jgi:diguanylate cyclase (GGDEF)-like protein